MKTIFVSLLSILILTFSACEDEEEELVLNDLINQEYEEKRNRLFAATVGYEEFEADVVEFDSIGGNWIIWAKSGSDQIKFFLPYLKEQVYWANDSNEVEMRYKKFGGEWYSSNWTKKEKYVVIEISRMDTTLGQLFGKFEGSVYNAQANDKLYVKRGVFNRLKYRVQ